MSVSKIWKKVKLKPSVGYLFSTFLVPAFQLDTLPPSYFQRQFEELNKNAQDAANSIYPISSIKTSLPSSYTPIPIAMHLSISSPQTVAGNEIVQLIHQVQLHQISNTHVLELYISILNPFPDSVKLAIYRFLSHLPIPEISSGILAIIVVFGPILLIVILIFIFWYVQKLIKSRSFSQHQPI